MKQTAVEWLMEQWPILESQIPERILNEAKEMEREQIIRTHLMARCYDTENSLNDAEQYYNETFKSE